MRYTMQNKKTECDGQQLVTGINCQPESVYADFMTTKRLHHKTGGVLFYHMVQSFPKGESVDPVAAHAAALKLAEYPYAPQSYTRKDKVQSWKKTREYIASIESLPKDR